MSILRRNYLSNVSIAAAVVILLILVCISGIANAAELPSSAGFTIVKDGQSQTVIVASDEKSAVALYAAQELQWHIEKATGARLEILSEKEAEDSQLPHRIYLGAAAAAKKIGINADALPNNSYRSKIDASAIYLVGKDDLGRPDDVPFSSGRWSAFKTGELPLDDTVSMGTLFAVYDWLETQLNAKWLWPDESGTLVTKTETLHSGQESENMVKPGLLFAQARLNTWDGIDLKRRPKYVYDTSVWLRRQRFARGMAIGGSGQGHAFAYYWKRFGETHPECFAMLPNGKRQPFNLGRPNLVQMCVSNPGFHQQVIDDWLEQRNQVPSRFMILAAENDRTAMDPPCQCEVCRSWDPEHPKPPLVLENPWLSGTASARNKDWQQISSSDRYAKFWLALQKKGQQHDPEATVLALAYTDYSDAPVETKLNPNIIVGVVPAYTYPMSAQESAEFQTVWDGWVATGASVYLRPNHFLTGYDLPHVYAKQFGHDFKHALKSGMVGTDFDSLVGMWGVQGINLYMMGRLTAHPDMSVDQVLHEYYSAFGAASGEIEKYFDHWQVVTAKIDTEFRKRANGGWSPLSRAGETIYTAETFTRGKELLQSARRKAAADQEVVARIDYLTLWLEHADLTMDAVTAFKRYRDKPSDGQLKQSFEATKTALDDYREAHADKVVNVGFLRYLENWWRK